MDGGGLAVFKSATIDAANRLDSVGFSGFTSGATADLYREGAGLAPAAGISANGEYTFLRKLAPSGYPQDTNANASDFVFASTTAGTFSGAASTNGSPGPRKLVSPTTRENIFTDDLLEPAAGSANPPNRARVATPVTNGAFGTMEFRRRMVNTSGVTVTRLRFRVIQITTTGSPIVMPLPQAQFRVLSAPLTQNVTLSDTITVVAVKGAVLEAAPTQGLAGGLGSTMTVDLGAGLANGQGVNVDFLVGVQAKGNFDFVVTWEAIP